MLQNKRQHKRFNSVMSSQLHVPCTDAQEHFNSYTQPLINLVSAHILARVRLCLFQLHNSLQFVFVCLFYKIKTEEHSNLHNATLLRRFRFYVGENSRTFQDRIAEFKDFSRLCEPCEKNIWQSVRKYYSNVPNSSEGSHNYLERRC